MKIAVVGTHGTGKTTLATKLYLHAVEHGYNTRLIHEVARDCPLGINEKFNLKSAAWIVSEHIKRELDAEAKGAKIIICDRSAIDPSMYLKPIVDNRVDDSIAMQLWVLGYRWLQTYDYIVWMRPSGQKIQDDGIRAVDLAFQQQVDENFSVTMGIAKEELEMPITEIIATTDHEKYTDELFENILKETKKND